MNRNLLLTSSLIVFTWVFLGSCSSSPKNAAYSVPENVQFFMSSNGVQRDLASSDHSINGLEFIARPGDPARRYRLKNNGELIRIWSLKKECSLGNGFQKVIAPKHPRDSNFLYAIKDGSLIALSSREGVSSFCNEVEIKTLMPDIQKTGINYSVTAQEHPGSEIVLVALDREHVFRAWSSERMIWERSKIESYQLNPCFSLKSRNDHEILAFLITEEGGKVLRLPSRREPAGKIEPEVVQDAYYTDLLQYVEKAEICAL